MLDDLRKPEGERTELIVEPLKNENGYYTGYLHKGELVRCKECKFREANKSIYRGAWYCSNHGYTVDLDDYCSYGERKATEITTDCSWK